jgi:hypothetical protein
MPPPILPPELLHMDITKFPYFEDGDVTISLSPCERQIVLHSFVLAHAFDAFKRSSIEVTKQRYELVCTKPEETEVEDQLEQTTLLGKGGFEYLFHNHYSQLT